MYHQVGEFRSPKAHRATFCHVRRFKAQMAYLARFNYKVISLQEALDGLFGNRPLSVSHCVALTFDDGYQNFRDHAFPVLQRHGFPATVFLAVGLLNGNARWLADEGREAPKLLDRESLGEMRVCNVTFGSHTLTHPFLTRVGPARRREEISASKTMLEDLLGEEIRHFCYPDGDFNAAVVDEVGRAGYTAALTCIRGSATSADNPLILPRKAISFGDSLIGYFWKLHMKHKKKAIPVESISIEGMSATTAFPSNP
jgi:peptidoglycan/xylan/chitin deacetylase (PgdA/CDA1 family)